MDKMMKDVAYTTINHDREPHCCGCYNITWCNGDPLATCNECGVTVELLDQLSRPAADAGDGEHVRRLVGKLDQWRLCMSHNASYFGEPAGMVKSVVEELAKAVDPIYPPKPTEPNPLDGVVIYTATIPYGDAGDGDTSRFVHLDEDGGFHVDAAILDTPGYQRQIEGAQMLSEIQGRVDAGDGGGVRPSAAAVPEGWKVERGLYGWRITNPAGETWSLNDSADVPPALRELVAALTPRTDPEKQS